MTKCTTDIIQRTNIGMGEGAVAESPSVLIASGLGSCVALILCDKGKKIGGMAHIMLPYSGMIHSPVAVDLYPPFWFVDTAVYTLLDGLLRRGAFLRHIEAKASGGACMFPVYNGESLGIGEQNVESIRGILTAMQIPITGWEVGGHHGRSVEFYLESDRVVIKAVGKEDKEI